MEEPVITEDDQGKTVVNADGDKLGIVSDVRNDMAYVNPDPGIGENIMSKLGWSGADEDDYPLERSKIEEVTDDQIRLRRDF
jgi:hypothetical protein